MNIRFSPVCLMPLLLAAAAHAAPEKVSVPELPATAIAAPAAAAVAAAVPAAAAAPSAAVAAPAVAASAAPAAAASAAAAPVAAASEALKDKPAMAELAKTAEAYKKYMCKSCGYIYDEAKGDPDNGVAPGTRWEDVPADWVCPECQEPKEMFEQDMEEVGN